MPQNTNNSNKKTWLQVAEHSDFPIQNIPFGVFKTRNQKITLGTRIGDFAIDLSALHQFGYFEGIVLSEGVFSENTLNAFISEGKKTWRAVRNRLREIFDTDTTTLQNNIAHRKDSIYAINEVEMKLPVSIGDYTDFYSSKEHATNIGTMFRDPENALLPNWLHIPVGYHGRSSTIIPSGTAIRRPLGQTMPKGAEKPVFGPSKLVDFELETAFITAEANALGEPIPIEKAEDYIFGMVLFNDWSARDIQKWEYVPLGPFLAKNFASSISPWIVTMDALEPYRVASPKQDPEPFPYLQQNGKHSFDIHLEVAIQPENGAATTVTKSNFKYMYWTMAQQLTHHAINGCIINSGDMMGSGTISGPTPDSYGSMLELSWQGTKPVPLSGGETRKFIEDNDTVILTGYCNSNGVRIGFGEVSTTLLPAFPFKK